MLYSLFFFFFFNDTATTEIYTLSLHDALPIFIGTTGFSTEQLAGLRELAKAIPCVVAPNMSVGVNVRSEEHTSELQSRLHLVCRLLLEKKKKRITKEQNEQKDE